jgi:uncharacterized protein YfdQ (DUF2303 family)
VIDQTAIEKFSKIVAAIQAPNVLASVAPAAPVPYTVIPDGWQVRQIDLPIKPSRIAARLALHEAAAFVSYVKEFCTPTTRVFLDQDKLTFTAILDYHNGGSTVTDQPGPEWCDHIATFTIRTTPEWEAWKGSNKNSFDQVEFAEFLEDNIVEVVEPSGADMLEITRSLEAKKDVSYSSGIRLANGAFRLHFDEAIRGTANTQHGTIDIPEEFKLQMQVVRGGSLMKFPARFKYRLKDRGLTLWYEIIRPHRIIEKAIEETVALIAEGTGVPIWKGVVTQTR